MAIPEMHNLAQRRFASQCNSSCAPLLTPTRHSDCNLQEALALRNDAVQVSAEAAASYCRPGLAGQSELVHIPTDALEILASGSDTSL